MKVGKLNAILGGIEAGTATYAMHVGYVNLFATFWMWLSHVLTITMSRMMSGGRFYVICATLRFYPQK